jgi:hypothetical protein
MRIFSPTLNHVQIADAILQANPHTDLYEFVDAMLQLFRLRGGRLVELMAKFMPFTQQIIKESPEDLNPNQVYETSRKLFPKDFPDVHWRRGSPYDLHEIIVHLMRECTQSQCYQGHCLIS